MPFMAENKLRDANIHNPSARTKKSVKVQKKQNQRLRRCASLRSCDGKAALGSGKPFRNSRKDDSASERFCLFFFSRAVLLSRAGHRVCHCLIVLCNGFSFERADGRIVHDEAGFCFVTSTDDSVTDNDAIAKHVGCWCEQRHANGARIRECKRDLFVQRV